MDFPETLPSIWMGLGNPGSRYRKTRHNVGYRVIDTLLERYGKTILKEKARTARVWEGSIAGKEVLMVKPTTYMNLSGQAAKWILDEKKVSPDALVVFHDDMDLALGRTKLKWKGGDAGHKGIRSITTYLQTDTFFRVRIGIGRPPEGVEAADYVLSDFTPDEEIDLVQTLDRIAKGMAEWVENGIENARNLLNFRH